MYTKCNMGGFIGVRGSIKDSILVRVWYPLTQYISGGNCLCRTTLGLAPTPENIFYIPPRKKKKLKHVPLWTGETTKQGKIHDIGSLSPAVWLRLVCWREPYPHSPRLEEIYHLETGHVRATVRGYLFWNTPPEVLLQASDNPPRHGLSGKVGNFQPTSEAVCVCQICVAVQVK